jgi:hypothetical protein
MENPCFTFATRTLLSGDKVGYCCPLLPYGGMENPCLTFAIPTLLSGDKVG